MKKMNVNEVLWNLLALDILTHEAILFGLPKPGKTPVFARETVRPGKVQS